MDEGAAIGINGREQEDKRICRVKEEFANGDCAQYIKMDAVKKYFKDSCAGKKHCPLEIYSNGAVNSNYFTEDAAGKCLGPRGQFFIQYACEIPEAEQEQRFNTV